MRREPSASASPSGMQAGCAARTHSSCAGTNGCPESQTCYPARRALPRLRLGMHTTATKREGRQAREAKEAGGNSKESEHVTCTSENPATSHREAKRKQLTQVVGGVVPPPSSSDSAITFPCPYYPPNLRSLAPPLPFPAETIQPPL